ncbi:MAG: anti-sigma factor [Planctomycetota bacterium]|nr:anti-sigma factor [Planctomycetota bacterium]MDP6370848.1 anti-sigma factor [Planctomycetota bacterium]MDP6518894.1 anti-sigma factor [Planctomycetota bacterium]MDP6839021.1 anti-sigma factor [Planctomycetota bacterium]MDP6954382.1 anti-sigma factor [Planctomycetota bacterium]
MNDVLSDYIDGELASPGRLLLWGHLMMCRRCRAYLKQFASIVDMAGTLPEDALPPGAEEALRGALEAWRAGDQRRDDSV